MTARGPRSTVRPDGSEGIDVHYATLTPTMATTTGSPTFKRSPWGPIPTTSTPTTTVARTTRRPGAWAPSTALLTWACPIPSRPTSPDPAVFEATWQQEEVDLVGNYHEIDVPTPPPEAPEGFPDDPPQEGEGPGALATDPALFQTEWRVAPEEDLEADRAGLYDEIVLEDAPQEPLVTEGEEPEIESNPAPAQAESLDFPP